MSAERTDEQVVKEKWPEAWVSRTGSQNGGPFYCVMVPFHKPFENVGGWKRIESDAWADAARRVERERGEKWDQYLITKAQFR